MMIIQTDWLIIGAHPDDVEIGMGGTIARFAAEGVTISVCDLTLAECSSNGDPQTRQNEAKIAADILGVRQRLNLKLPDRGLQVIPEHVNALARMIRCVQPKVVFGPTAFDRHPDHVRTSQIVGEALMNARLRKIEPDLPAWTVSKAWQYHIHQWNQPQWLVDIGSVYDRKQMALSAYRSQFEPTTGREGEDRVVTPINQQFLEQIEARDRLWGSQIRCPYAEAFTTSDLQLIHSFS